MKVIKDEDLISLHYQIEKAEVKQQKLEEQLRYNLKKLKKTKGKNKLLFVALGLLSFLLVFFANSYFSGASADESVNSQIEMVSMQSEMNKLQDELIDFQKEKADLEVIKELYLYRDLINKDTIYSVQINALDKKKLSALSDKYINGKIYNDTSFFKISLGIFETLQEAQEFRKTLVGSGFSERIFVISYKDGNRIRIEKSVN